MQKIPRVSITPAAAAVIDRLRAENGALLFHQSGGCCDGSAPMCYPAREFRVGASDVWVGTIHDCPFFMNDFQFFLNWLSGNPVLAFLLIALVVEGIAKSVYYFTHRNNSEESDD